MDAGYAVAADYAGNDEAASSFTADATSAIPNAGVKSSPSCTSGCIRSNDSRTTSIKTLILLIKDQSHFTLR